MLSRLLYTEFLDYLRFTISIDLQSKFILENNKGLYIEVQLVYINSYNVHKKLYMTCG